MFVGIVLAIGAYAAIAQTNVTGNSLDVQVYADGSAYITQHLAADPKATSVGVQLLSSLLSGVVVTDSSGAPLEYQLSGTNITVYTLGTSEVTLRYDTLNLTSKSGTVWTVEFATAYNTTLTLPKSSTLTYISGSPNSLTIANGSPVVTISPGRWLVNYGVTIGQIGETTNTTSSASTGSTSTTTSATTSGPFPTVPPADWTVPVAVAAIILAAVAFMVWLRRRRQLGPAGADLRPDDVQVLNFISENGGKVLESEIRSKFILPKTSAWRQIKRLERLGYVKVTRIGSQNQIELVKNREQGGLSRN